MTEVRGSDAPVAEVLRPALDAALGELPVRVTFWDGSALGPVGEEGLALHVRSPDALRRMLWAPGELGVGRAYVAGEIEIEGDVFELLRRLRDAGRRLRKPYSSLPAVVRAVKELGLIDRPPPPPPEEARPRGRRHQRTRDAASVRHHYDVGNDFYRLVLGPSLTYSCARFEKPDATLEDAQWSKHELICRKLGLHERSGMRLLDVGCGWGSLVLHAARHHGALATGITLSREQAAAASRRIDEAGLADRVEVQVLDYRDLTGEPFDAISSVGMFEHVGAARMATYFTTLRSLLPPTGRLLNHAISSPGGSSLGRRSFVHRYVFPDGELIDVGEVVLAMQRAGFEVRDVEGLREHYSRTLEAWVANLDDGWDRAVELVGEGRARVWRLYMAASAVGFADGGFGVHQVLGVVQAEDGTSGMPPTRDAWATPPQGEEP
jgi:cyclopropane-fatty-acyl-phospholipid synthase